MQLGLYAFLGAAVVTIGGCAASAPTCSSDEVVKIVKQIAAQKVAEVPAIGNIFDIPKTEYNLKSIRTDSTATNSVMCKASLVISYKISDKFKETKKVSPYIYEQTLGDGVRDDMYKDKSFDISYKAQLTDDKKETYVEVEGLW